MKRFLSFAFIVIMAGTACGMTGGPIFTVPQGMTSMTVEASKVNWQIASARATDGKESVISDRVGLTARYGLSDFLDFGAMLGAATFGFDDLPRGYSFVSDNWTFAWGASMRMGIPAKPRPYQLSAGVNYMGYQPSTTTSKGFKTIDSKYLWHEISPVATFGVRLSSFVPYLGVSKTYLSGNRDIQVRLNGVEVDGISGKEDYVDSEQQLRGIVGLEWKLPDGYSIGIEANGNMDGFWSMSIGLAQVLR